VVAIVGVALAALIGACSDQYVCPQGSGSSHGRCRLLPEDVVDPDAFVWPPADTTEDLGTPPPIGGDAAAGRDVTGDDDGAAAADGSADGTPAPADAGDAADAGGQTADGP
jgi:hypothetical protein